MAVQLVGKHGLHRTAQTLKLEYYSLKKRVAAAQGRRPKNRSEFVEIPASFTAIPECVIELEDGAVSLRVHLKGYSAADVAVVGRSVRGA